MIHVKAGIGARPCNYIFRNDVHLRFTVEKLEAS